LEIIGEALGQARHADETLETRLPKLPRIVALRNRVIHGYDTVDDSATGSRFPAVEEGAACSRSVAQSRRARRASAAPRGFLKSNRSVNSGRP
jgi:hypothetical protein